MVVEAMEDIETIRQQIIRGTVPEDVEETENWYNCKAVLGFNDSGNLNYILQEYPNNYPIPHSTSALSSLASSKANTVASVYNSNINLYGRWKHGIGNGIGY